MKFRNKIKIRKPSFKFKRPAIKEFKKPHFPTQLKPRLPSKIKNKLPKISLHRPKLIPQRVKVFYANKFRPILGRIKRKLKSIWNVYRHSKILILFSMICLVFISVIVALFLIQPSVKVDFIELKAPTVEDQIILTSNTDKLDMFGKGYYAILPNGKEVLLDRYKFNASDFEQGDNLLKIHTVKALILLNLVSEKSTEVKVFVDTIAPEVILTSEIPNTFTGFINFTIKYTDGLNEISLFDNDDVSRIFVADFENTYCIDKIVNEETKEFEIRCKYDIREEKETKLKVMIKDENGNEAVVFDKKFELIIPMKLDCGTYPKKVKDTSVELECFSNKKGIIEFQDKKVQFELNAPTKLRFDLAQEGANEIKMKLVDEKQREFGQNFSINRDTTAPSIEIVSGHTSFQYCAGSVSCINWDTGEIYASYTIDPFNIVIKSNENVSLRVLTSSNRFSGNQQEIKLDSNQEYSYLVRTRDLNVCETYGFEIACSYPSVVNIEIWAIDDIGNENYHKHQVYFSPTY